MLSIKKGLDCYQSEKLLDKPYGYNSTHVIVNAPNDIHCHRFNIKLCSKGANIRNPNFKKGNMGDLMHHLAIEKALLAYIGFHALTCRDFETTRGEVSKAKLFGLRNETDHGFDRMASDFNNGIIWLLQNEWYRNHNSIISLHNFLNMFFNSVLGCKTRRDPLSPIREVVFAAKPLERMNGTYEKDQLKLLVELKNYVTKQIRFNHPKVVETFYSYRPHCNNRGIFLEIDIYMSCQFDLLDQVLHTMLDSRKGTYFQKLFQADVPLGVDLVAFYLPDKVEKRFVFGKNHPENVFESEREIGFMSIEQHEKLVAEDEFSSSDDEHLVSPVVPSTRNRFAAVTKDS